MQRAAIAEVVGGIPWMTDWESRRMTDLIREHRPREVLELGFKHGVSSCYIAGALEENGRGHLTTIDLASARELEPDIETLLERLGLRDRVSVYHEDTSYTWRLMEFLERTPRPSFDLCYLDGAHNWDTDGLAFFLVDKLLAKDAVLILDDLDWSYERSPTLQNEPWVRAMPAYQYRMQQVRKVYDLLVCEHPDYGDFQVDHGWGIARKHGKPWAAAERIYVTRLVRETQRVGLGAALLKLGHAARRRLAQ